MKIRKIFVAAPGYKDNGGGESLHQLVDACNNMGYDAYIFYFHPKRNTVLEKMQEYNIKITQEIEDNQENLLICPESYTYLTKKYKYIRKCIWFLSLDFYLRSLPIYRTKHVIKKWHIPKMLFPLVFFLVIMRRDVSIFNYKFKDGSVDLFLYNVEYAREFIETKALYPHASIYLCAPINKIYFSMTSLHRIQKERLVVYNPKKANGFTQKIIDALYDHDKSIQVIPIQGLVPEKVMELLSRASVYMDFGYFPGPERMPREAAIMGCNIITSTLGCAANNIDVPIDKQYKFDLTDENINKIVCLISCMVNHYPDYTDAFVQYRDKILRQRRNFCNNVLFLLNHVETYFK